MREPGGDAIDCGSLAEELVSAGTEGVTISGGEPFAQAGAVARVVSRMKEMADRGVIVYTGYAYEELTDAARRDAGVAALLGETDILIDGRYVIGLDDGRPYRGSSNQRALCLTGRYAGVFDSYYNAPHGRRVEINIGPRGAALTGVPSPSALEAWRKLLSDGLVAKAPR
jgi:anaerobic ribonucleoside-triphosphate reductase activating protein